MAIKTSSLRLEADGCGVGGGKATGDKVGAWEGTLVGTGPPPVGFPVATDGACVVPPRVGVSVGGTVGDCERGLALGGDVGTMVAGAATLIIVGATEDVLNRGAAADELDPKRSSENHTATPTTAQHVKITINGVSHPFDGLFLPPFVDASAVIEIVLIYKSQKHR